jgi:hypothetical protein
MVKKLTLSVKTLLFFCKNWITALVFNKNAKFLPKLGKNRQK